LDLASTTDLAALCAYFPEGGELLSWFWTPEEGLEEAERRDHVPYALWKRQDFIETTPGRTIGRDFIVQRLREIASDYDVQCLAFDRWGTKELKRLMDDIGLKLELEDHGQGFRDMTPSVAAFEIAVLDGKLKHNSNPVMNWCVANTVIQPDPAGGRKPTKEKSTGRIDGTVAGIMCVGVAARTAPKKPSVYRTRGVRIF
jgi:phage terminase large subunit-like protein